MTVAYATQDEARLAFIRQAADSRPITEEEFREAVLIGRKMRGGAMSTSATSRLTKSAMNLAARTPSAAASKKAAAAAAVDDLFK